MSFMTCIIGSGTGWRPEYTESQEDIQRQVEQIREHDRRVEAARLEQIQVDHQNLIIAACRDGNLEQVPGWLRELDDAHFLALNQQMPEGSEETLNRMCEMLITEQNRRFPNNTNNTGLRV